MINKQTEESRIYDLEERTARFGEKIIDLLKELPDNSINKRLISQLAASGGSTGANYCEASEAESKKEAQQLLLIFSKCLETSRKGGKNR